MSRLAALVVVAAAAAACAAPAGTDEPVDRCPGCAPGTVVSTGLALSATDARVTGVAFTPGEPPWFAGTYTQMLAVPPAEAIGALGTPDVPFIARVGPRETGGAYVATAESTMRVRLAGIVPDQEVGAAAIVDAFLGDGGTRIVQIVTVDHRRQQVRRIDLASVSEPPDTGIITVTTADPRGWPIIGVTGTDLSTTLLPDSTMPGLHGAVMRLGQGWYRELLYLQPGIEITSVAAPDAGTIVIGGRYTGTPPGWPECTEAWCGFVAAIDGGTGTAETPLRWLRILRATGSAEIHAIAASPDGDVAALVEITGDATEPALPAGPASVFLAYLDAAGADRAQQVLASEPVPLGGRRGLAYTDAGTVVVALSVGGSGVLELAGRRFEADGLEPDDHDSVVAEIDRDAGALWSVPIGAEDARVGSLAVAGDQVAVGGSFVGLLVGPVGPLASSVSPSTQGFVVEVAR